MKKASNNKTNILNGVSTLDFLHNKIKIGLLLLILTTFSSVTYAGFNRGHSTLDLVDPGFTPEIQSGSFDAKDINVILPLANGNILVGGKFNSYNTQPTGTLVRLKPDGTLDTTFNMILETQTGEENQVLRAVLQTDGKIIVQISNSDITINNQGSKSLIRLNTDGSIDPTFDFNGTLGTSIGGISIDDMDRVILIGNQTSFSGITRLSTDGSIDKSFQFTPNVVYSMTTQENKVIAYSSSTGNNAIVEKYNEDGTIDNTFNSHTPQQRVENLTVQTDGKILVTTPNTLYRLNQNGSKDSTFQLVEFPSIFFFRATIDLLDNGKIVIAHQDDDGLVNIKRLLPDGTIDSAFNEFAPSNFKTLATQTDGNVIVGDSFFGGVTNGIAPNGLTKLLPNGIPDNSFNVGGIAFQSLRPGLIQALAVQSDDKILIGGKFNFINNIPRSKIARLNSDSTLDTDFQIDVSGANNTFTRISSIDNIALQTDGKIIMFGDFDYLVNSVTKRKLVRLNSDGSIDSTFELSVMLHSSCCDSNKAIPLDDNKLIVGTSRYVDAPEDSIPIKLNADGTLDSSFNTDIFPIQNNVRILDLVIQPNGKIIIGGWHSISTPTSETPKSFVARLNIDGSIDQTFQINEEDDKEIANIDLLPSGKILIVKRNRVTFPASLRQSRVLRLNINGSIDNSFNTTATVDDKINTLLALPTGQIFIGGNFTSFNGQNRVNLAQLNENGSLNSVTYSVNSEVLSLAVDSDARLIVGGGFTIIDAGNNGGSTRSHLARLVDSEATNYTRLDFDNDGRADLGVFNKTDGMWTIRHSDTSQSVSTKFGLDGDKVVPADFDGDGQTDIAVYRPSEGNWYLNQSNTGFTIVRWGVEEDIPMPADFDGDGKDDFAVWRPSEGNWYIYQSAKNNFSITKFGLEGDIPLPAVDFDGDSKDDIAVWRPSDGNFYWLESGSNNRFNVVHFGTLGDIPAAADYNGDGKTDLAVFRPSEGNWYQFLTNENGEYTFAVTKFGLDGDEPVPADYDGDGKTDIAIRRENAWYLLLSSQGFTASTFGDVDTDAIASLANQQP